MLPALRQIRFFDAKRGWAAGNSSPMFPAGAFLTRDGGRSWTPSCGGRGDGWLAGDFLDEQTGMLAGRRGQLAVLRRGDFQPGRAGDAGLQSIRQLRFAGPGFAWLAGDGGLLLFTADAGRASGANRPPPSLATPPPCSTSPPWPSAVQSAGWPGRRGAACCTPPTAAARGSSPPRPADCRWTR